MNDKPLFIPLKSEYYEAFQEGTKEHEYRVNGSRWNFDTCRVGRRVILSKGYGKKNRMIGRISGVQTARGTAFRDDIRRAIMDCYGTLDLQIIQIAIKDLHPHIDV